MSKVLLSWNLLPLYRVTSRNVSSFELISCVNFIVLCNLFSSSMYSLNSVSDPFHIMNISSM